MFLTPLDFGSALALAALGGFIAGLVVCYLFHRQDRRFMRERFDEQGALIRTLSGENTKLRLKVAKLERQQDPADFWKRDRD